MTQAFIGIDPGAKGGIALLMPNRVEFKSLPDRPNEIWNLILELTTTAEQCDEVHTLIEQVSGFQGVAHPGSRMFSFGKCCGWIEMALVGLLPSKQEGNIHTVLPKVWQKGLGISSLKKTGNKSKDDTAWKNHLKREAERRFPELLIIKATADALLIAAYCRQENEYVERD